MNLHIDKERLIATIDLIKQIEPDDRLAALKKLVIETGGRWDLPSERVGDYSPALVSIQLFGVHAMSDDVATLPSNWLKAANNTVDAENELKGAAA